jgi:N utilization substance protein B
MSVRREGREAAVQFLYSLDRNRAPDGSDFALFWSIHQAGPAVRAFAEELVRGLLPQLPGIDAAIQRTLEHWDLDRLEVVDRSILRLAIHEMFHCPETPPVVALNEAIEIARRLGTPDSGRFVNGVLDKVMATLDRPLRSPAAKASTAGSDHRGEDGLNVADNSGPPGT